MGHEYGIERKTEPTTYDWTTSMADYSNLQMKNGIGHWEFFLTAAMRTPVIRTKVAVHVKAALHLPGSYLLEPKRSGLNILKSGKVWWYQALSVGAVFFGREILTSIANKRTKRKTMAIMILSNQIAMRSFRNSRSRRRGVCCARLLLRLSRSLSDIFLARLSLWLFCLPKSLAAHDPRDDESSGCNDPRIVPLLLSRRPFQRLGFPVPSIAIASASPVPLLKPKATSTGICYRLWRI
jgi:hypothetical protein